MDIRFRCTFCGGEVTAAGEIAGQMVPCPKCMADLKVPAPMSAPPDPPAPGEQRHPCPACGEQILAGAILCFKCKTRLDGPLPLPGPRPVPPAPPVRSGNTTMWVVITILGCLILLCGGGILASILTTKSVAQDLMQTQCLFNLYDVHCSIRKQAANGVPEAWNDKTGSAFLILVSKSGDGCPWHTAAGAAGLGFRGPQVPYGKLAQDGVVACDLEANHDGKLNVLYKDGTLRRCAKGDPEYDRALRETIP